jgi:hypothetical protein
MEVRLSHSRKSSSQDKADQRLVNEQKQPISHFGEKAKSPDLGALDFHRYGKWATTCDVPKKSRHWGQACGILIG